MENKIKYPFYTYRRCGGTTPTVAMQGMQLTWLYDQWPTEPFAGCGQTCYHTSGYPSQEVTFAGDVTKTVLQ